MIRMRLQAFCILTGSPAPPMIESRNASWETFSAKFAAALSSFVRTHCMIDATIYCTIIPVINHNSILLKHNVY